MKVVTLVDDPGRLCPEHDLPLTWFERFRGARCIETARCPRGCRPDKFKTLDGCFYEIDGNDGIAPCSLCGERMPAPGLGFCRGCVDRLREDDRSRMIRKDRKALIAALRGDI